MRGPFFTKARMCKLVRVQVCQLFNFLSGTPLSSLLLATLGTLQAVWDAPILHSGQL
jgi:hypothetical protein